MSTIVYKKLTDMEEQRSFNLIPIRAGNVALVNMTITRNNNIDGFQYASSSTGGATLTFKFYGKRIGIQATRGNSFGKLTFMIDGRAFPTLDTSTTDGSFYNIPYIIANDLPDGEHTLVVSKLDTNITAISGFLVDESASSNVYSRSGMDLYSLNPIDPVDIGTADTTISSSTIWGFVTINNTTAATITVTLKSNYRTVFVIDVPARGIIAIPNPVYFNGAFKASASAVGCTITIGGQA